MCDKRLTPSYVTNDGQRLLRGTPEEVVDLLREGSFNPGTDRREWMRNAAGRARDQTGAIVPWGTAEEFIDGLVHSGLLRRIVLN